MTRLATRSTRLAGLGNQTRREAAMWWSTGRWHRQAAVWTLLLGGLLAAMLWVLPGLFTAVEGGEAMTDDPVAVAAQFAELAMFVSALGVVILTQGLLLDDQRSGLTEWLLSKPLSRPALVLAKLLGHSGGLLVSLVVLPWVAVYLLLWAASGQPWPVARFAGTVGLVALFVVFHVALVLALSAWTGSRGAVLAVPLALLVLGDLVVTAAAWTADFMPYLLSRIAGALLGTGQLAAAGPVLATAAGAIALTAAAMWRFSTREL